MIKYTRQEKLINTKKLKKLNATLIGAGGIGSFTALTLMKMGLDKLEVYDDDGVEEHNLPNQFYMLENVKQFKVDALKKVVHSFTGSHIIQQKKEYTNQKLNQLVIVGTDSMESRKKVWAQFKKQKQCKYYIEARMGGENGRIYTIVSKKKSDIAFYEGTLYSDKSVPPIPCTAKSIIYNVLIIASFICRAVKSIVENIPMPREVIINLANINRASLLLRD